VTLPERLVRDIDVLRSVGHRVDVIEDGPRCYVIVRDVNLPGSYEPRATDVMMMADYQYPQSALDMFWTLPHVRVSGGAWPQNADQMEIHCEGLQWQRWSWHYGGWNPATHSLLTHLEVCFSRLAAGT
jgi:E2/UBC family protein E